jgi:two-component system, chemotaxis family, chemotaxis protein CheY
MKESGRSNASPTKTAAIVEDDEDLVYIYSRILKDQGYDSVFVARSGEEIIHWISTDMESPDVVIMDYKLPAINGLEAAREVLRHSPRTKIIIATAHDEIKAEAQTLGFSFLRKPFSMKTLASEMRQSRTSRLKNAAAGPVTQEVRELSSDVTSGLPADNQPPARLFA